MDNALAIYRLYLPHPPMEVGAHKAAAQLSLTPSHFIAAAAESCTDAACLRQTLEEMGAVGPVPALPDVSELMLLREAQFLSIVETQPADLAPAMTGRELTRVVLENYWFRGYGVRYTRLQLLGRWWHFLIHSRTDILRDTTGRLAFQLYTAELLGMRDRAVGAWIAHAMNDLRPNDTPRTPAFVVARARAAFDLARLALASRIEELESRPRPTHVEELVPRYFPEPLLDPFSGKPFLYSASGEVFYSVGPDGADDGIAQRCDPKEGVKAKGDYWLPRHDGEPWQAMWRE